MKWAEVEPLTTITTMDMKNFLWELVVCRYGIPHFLVIDNGMQFDYKPFRDWCAKLKIRHYFSSVSRPQGNGQVKQLTRL
jgi:hypothetical protein